MSLKIAEFTNDTAQTLTADSNILFSNASYSSNLYKYNSDGTISILIPGVYQIASSCTLLATAEGAVSVSMKQNSATASGATATATLGAAGDYANIAIINVAKIIPSSGSAYANISFAVSAATSVTNAACIIQKVG